MQKCARGFSLIEVIIAVAVMAVLALGITSMLKTGFMGQKTLQAQDDARILTTNMVNILQRPVACKNTFGIGSVNPATAGGAVITEVKDDKPPSGNVQFRTYPPDNRYGNRGLELVGLTIGGTIPELDPKTKIKRWDPEAPASGPVKRGTAFVRVDWRQVGTGTNRSAGPELLQRYFMVYVTNVDASGNITDCTAMLGGDSGGDGGGPVPPGFVAIGNEGEPGRFFIEQDNNGQAKFWDAQDSCASRVGMVAHLCSHSQWYAACYRKAALGIPTMGNQYEWVADFVGDFNDGDPQDAVIAGGHHDESEGNKCQSVRRNQGGIYNSSEHNFRCCITP